jgi:UDP-N-acetylmuramoyl-L-alanyl-D-glutamate--2,6-diaminopimelate ligase
LYVNVSGRMNKIIHKNKTIIVDFAHTPSSVENVLTNILEFSNNKITLVIGCGGNRDKAKRKIIAELAIKYANKVIFTTDNPSDEDPMEIINDMVSRIPSGKYEVYLDRKEAILKALEDNTKDEVILLLGKGSEPYQIANGIKYPFSDKKVVYDWIKNN